MMESEKKGKTFEGMYGKERARDIREKISKKLSGYHNSPKTEYRKGHKPTHGFGPKHPAHKYWLNKNRGSEFWINHSKKMKGRKLTKEHKENISNSLKGKPKPWLKGKSISREHVRKILRRRTPSSLEKKMIEIIEEHNLPYKFVGDGKFFIERKNPDFINCNGEKIALEVFCRKHKELFRDGVKKWKKERQNIFKKYGWEIIFLNETQVNKDYVLKIIGGKN